MIPKVINVQEMEAGIDDGRPPSKVVLAWVAKLIMETIPSWLTVGAMLALIFGGCCSNVSLCQEHNGKGGELTDRC